MLNFNYGEWPAPPGSTRLTSISTPTGAVSFGYQTVTMNHNFQNEIIVENAPASFAGVSSVTVPQRPTYSFNYCGYGMIYNISLATGGGSATVTYNYPLGGEELYGGPVFTQRTESPNAVYTYAVDGIIRPDGTKLILSGVDRELKSTTNTTLSKTVSTLTTDPGGSPAVQSVRTYDELGQQIKTDFDYDVYGNVINEREYGYQIGGQWKVRRRTHYAYINWEPYISAYLRNLVTMVEVFDALQNTNDADDVLIGKTVMSYDSPLGGMEGYGGTANPPGHLSSYGTSYATRGNLTGVTKYPDLGGAGVTHSNKTDIFGNVTKAQVACCDEKSFTMTEATYWTKPSQTTSGNTSGIYLTSSAGYDFNTLTTTSNTDPNNQTTTFSYDSQQNPTGFTSPAGATGTTAYNVWSAPTSKSFTYSEGGVNKTITETAVYDGWGQMTQSVDANGAQTNYTYNNMGRMITRTNPFPQAGTPGPMTTYQYDQLGRVTLVTLPGGNTIQTTFSGSVVTMTDEVNRKIKREADGLGRLIKVTEQDATGILNQDTTYSYDIADRLTLVNQGNQTRSQKYDAEGRLLFERLPEISATINDGTGTMWSTKYTYTDWGAVATKQDARGVITTCAYDTLHRLTSVSYNTSGAPGVPATPTVTYNFDNVNNSPTKGLLLSISVGTGYSESYAYDSNKRVSSVTRTMDGRNYATSYQYNTANQQTQMTYSSGRVINLGHDSKGRRTSVGSFLSSVTYNGIGQVTGLALGNGVTESYGYDANRMQLTSQTATKSGGPANGLMDLTYGYQASAGQMGAGSTFGNAGQLMTIGGTINGTTESASYAYDLLGRLTTSNQTSNGSSAQRRFAYDRWGNRTSVWDAVTGGTLIQNVALEQSGGVPTNRIGAVSLPGWYGTFSYDAAGNVTWDGTHAYTYDAENRIVSVDGGATAVYAYDASNQRHKKVTVGATTHYIWQASQVIAEHDGSTGAGLGDYVYSGSRMMARASGLTAQYFLTDRLSMRMTLSSSGSVLGRQAHLPFGEDFAESGIQEKHHFTSYERDAESGLDYAVNRYDSPTLGRFATSDPILALLRMSGPDCHTSDDYQHGLLLSPQQWNRYAYQAGDPVNGVDPLGLESRYFKCLRQCITSPGTGVGFVGGVLCGAACRTGNAPVCALCLGASIGVIFLCMQLCAHMMMRPKGPAGLES